MELEPNMYVRTKDNGIGKIIEYINNPTHYFFKCYKLDRNCINCEEYITESDVSKASYNIIDLIEVDDYVNGERVIGFGTFYYDDGTIERTSLTLDITVTCLDSEIKSIVTKEQFSKMEYKVGDDK